MARDWNQLRILSATQSYNHQYGKMAYTSEKEFHKTKSLVTMQRQLRQQSGKIPPSSPSLRAWNECCINKGSASKGTTASRLSVSAERERLMPEL